LWKHDWLQSIGCPPATILLHELVVSRQFTNFYSQPQQSQANEGNNMLGRVMSSCKQRQTRSTFARIRRHCHATINGLKKANHTAATSLGTSSSSDEGPQSFSRITRRSALRDASSNTVPVAMVARSILPGCCCCRCLPVFCCLRHCWWRKLCPAYYSWDLLILVVVLVLGLPCILRLGSLMLVVLVKLPLLVAGSAAVELILTLFLFAEWS